MCCGVVSICEAMYEHSDAIEILDGIIMWLLPATGDLFLLFFSGGGIKGICSVETHIFQRLRKKL